MMANSALISGRGYSGVEIGVSPRKSAVTRRNAALLQTQTAVYNMLADGCSQRSIAARFGVNPATVHRIINEPDYWSGQMVRATTGQNWQTVPAHVLLPDGTPPPDELVLELRRCDVTDRYFVPTCERQRFHPDTSPALRRAGRRNLDEARKKYRRLGRDWGKR